MTCLGLSASGVQSPSLCPDKSRKGRLRAGEKAQGGSPGVCLLGNCFSMLAAQCNHLESLLKC